MLCDSFIFYLCLWKYHRYTILWKLHIFKTVIHNTGGYPLQYSGLENSMVCVVHGVTKSWKQLNDFHSLEGVVRSLIAIIQRGHNQLMYILLIGWW